MHMIFRVDGVPPKKDGATSMWRKRSELARLKSLRPAAVAVVPRPISVTTAARLTLRVYAPSRAGDLDNFVTGICDGLIAAPPRTPVDAAQWVDVPERLRPGHPIAFLDESCVGRIEAKRLPPTGAYYEVELAWG